MSIIRDKFAWKPPIYKQVQNYLINEYKEKHMINETYFMKDSVIDYFKSTSKNEIGQVFSYLIRQELISGPFTFEPKLNDKLFYHGFQIKFDGQKWIKPAIYATGIDRRPRCRGLPEKFWRVRKKTNGKIRYKEPEEVKWDGIIYKLNIDSSLYKELSRVEQLIKCKKCGHSFMPFRKFQHEKKCKLFIVSNVMEENLYDMGPS